MKYILILLIALACQFEASAQQRTLRKDEMPELPAFPEIPEKKPIGSVKLGDVSTFEEVQLDIPITDGPFQPTWQSIEANYPGEAEWLREAKVGFWVHFGPQSAGESGDWYARNLYKEAVNHHAYRNHVKRYGHPSEVDKAPHLRRIPNRGVSTSHT